MYTIKCRVSSELHFWFDVWVPLAALSANFLGKYSLIGKRCSFLKQNMFTASTNFIYLFIYLLFISSNN